MPSFPHIWLAAAGAVLFSACAPSHTYRLTADGILVPPAVRSTSKRQGKVRLSAAGTCDGARLQPPAQQRGTQLTVRPHRNQLAKLSSGSLRDWAGDLESSGCIAPGSAFATADRVSLALPLPLNRAAALARSAEKNRFADLYPGYSLRVVSPVFRDGVENPSVIGEEVDVGAGGSGGIVVTLRASDDLRGYETAWFDLEPRAQGRGAQLRFRRASRQIGEESEPVTDAQGNYFQFAEDMAYFRIVFPTRESEAVDHDSYVLAARTLAELDTNTDALMADPAHCGAWAVKGQCAATPKLYAVVSFLWATVNGERLPLAPGATVAEALREAGIAYDQARGPLRIEKPYEGELRLVEIPSGDTRILEMRLVGGETISTL